MRSYTAYRIVALLPLTAVIIGIVLFFSPVGHYDVIMNWFWLAQIITLLTGIATYTLGVRRGMPHSVIIMLSQCVAMVFIVAIGLFILFSTGFSLGLSDLLAVRPHRIFS
ncbi:MAG: hypothetical protein JWQ98_1274 [Chlorobi bacterium]|nr:hypothetical protein [Chlorobiota bacterium]